MIRCKDAMEDSTCGKVICCVECEEPGCIYRCDLDPSDCGSAVNEANAIAELKNAAGDLIQAISDLSIQKKKIEDQEKAMRASLCDAMERYGVKKFENSKVVFTYVAPTTRTTLDSAKIKKELPEVAEKYSKTSNVSASVKIEVK